MRTQGKKAYSVWWWWERQPTDSGLCQIM